MKPRLALRAWCLLLFGLTGACDLGEPTQITLRVDGDLHAVDGFDAVLVNAFHLKGEELSAQPDRWFPGSRYQRGEGMVLDQREYVARHSRLYRVDDDPLPIELAFYPKAGDSTRVALFEAFGMRCGATAPSHECEIIVSTGARTQFVRDRHETLTLYLSAACRGVVCPAGAYCRLGRCLDPDIDPECFDASGVPCAEGDAAVSDAVASGDASTPDGTVIPDGAADGGAMDTATPPPRTCTSADPCSPAGAFDEERQDCGMCGRQERRRTCQSDCTWGDWSPWGTCEGEGGTCVPGSTQMGTEGGCPGETECGYRPWTQTCGDDCEWIWPASYGACVREPSCIAQGGAEVCEGTRTCCEGGTAGCPGCSIPDLCRLATCGSSGWEDVAPGCL